MQHAEYTYEAQARCKRSIDVAGIADIDGCCPGLHALVFPYGILQAAGMRLSRLAACPLA